MVPYRITINRLAYCLHWKKELGIPWQILSLHEHNPETIHWNTRRNKLVGRQSSHRLLDHLMARIKIFLVALCYALIMIKICEGKRNQCQPYPSCNKEDIIEFDICSKSSKKCWTRTNKLPKGSKLVPIRKTWTFRKEECETCFQVCMRKSETMSEYRERRTRMKRMATGCYKLKDRLKLRECFHIERVCRRDHHYPDGEKAVMCRTCTKVCNKVSEDVPNVNSAVDRATRVAKWCNVEKMRFCANLRVHSIPVENDAEFSKYCGE